MLLNHLELEADETIIATVHKHWFVIAVSLLQSAVTACIPIIVWVLVLILSARYLTTISIDPYQYQPYVIFFECAWLIFVFMVAAYNFTVIWLDVWVITDRRIVTVDQVSFFRRHIASFRLERLQDITIDIDGLVATFLDFGTLEAQTASESGAEFRVRYMPHPEAIKAMILKATDTRLGQQVPARPTGTP